MTIKSRPYPAARKRFGQHFLERAWADKVVRAIDPAPTDTFVEIGPGRGAITLPLAARAKRVVAIEIDRELSALLRETAAPNLEVVDANFLDTSAGQLRKLLGTVEEGAALRVAGNLPYNVAAPILFKLVDLFAEGVPFADATVMLQREVANRLTASPGTKDYGVLTVLIGHTARIDRLLQLPAGAFRPAPKVQSTVVRLTFHAPEALVADVAAFRRLTQALFTRRRKTLANALAAYVPAAGRARELLESAGLDPQRRPETLTVAEVARLADLTLAHRPQ